MSQPVSRLCPYCVLTLLGIVVLLGIPDLGSIQTPLGQASLILLWLPLTSALLRQGLLRAARASAPPAAQPPR